ncbi:MAG: class I SAM-dependent methyltransferase [Oceanicoccus sp.]|uniref:class I SAM-dependent methyltransferase n=1 Tax=Oceanicoccus sp. TaxID=2691044 RepID=UPI0026286EC6|nr:class I SAM-dependent methyltransferase [Oceanicoccus sp.]MDG1772121.1 class I SAM-dependent methyltransferase [Oceanicoccus sp.]
MYQDEWNNVAKGVNFNLEIDLHRFSNKVSSESRILDFGCGYGCIIKQLWDNGYKNIAGVDSSAKMIERGNIQYPYLELSLVSGNTLSIHDNSFDVVVVCAVFTCITSLEIRVAQFNEIFRILKPNGLLHMVEFCAESSKEFTSEVGVPMLHSSPNELRNLVNSMQVTHEEVVNTETLGGRKASSYSLFARKSLNKSNIWDAVTDTPS